jgi:hypothetical protein
VQAVIPTSGPTAWHGCVLLDEVSDRVAEAVVA